MHIIVLNPIDLTADEAKISNMLTRQIFKLADDANLHQCVCMLPACSSGIRFRADDL